MFGKLLYGISKGFIISVIASMVFLGIIANMIPTAVWALILLLGSATVIAFLVKMLFPIFERKQPTIVYLDANEQNPVPVYQQNFSQDMPLSEIFDNQAEPDTRRVSFGPAGTKKF